MPWGGAVEVELDGLGKRGRLLRLGVSGELGNHEAPQEVDSEVEHGWILEADAAKQEPCR